MNLTKSLCCRRLSFTNANTCPHCAKTFQPGTLKSKAVAEDKAFDRKARVLFIVAFLVLPAVLFVLQFQNYLPSTP
jgi:hypothetical protein